MLSVFSHIALSVTRIFSCPKLLIWLFLKSSIWWWMHECHSFISHTLFSVRTRVSPEHYPEISSCTRICSRECPITLGPGYGIFCGHNTLSVPNCGRTWGHWGVLEFSHFRSYFEDWRSSCIGWGSAGLLFCPIWHPEFLICLIVIWFLMEKSTTWVRKIRKSPYPGHLHIMWGASKKKEKPLKRLQLMTSWVH